MATLPLGIRSRPLKIGFLVRHGEIEDVLEAARLCSVLWGGMFNPLIPSFPDRPDPSQDILLEDFQVDVVHPVFELSVVQDLPSLYPDLAWPFSFTGGLLEGRSSGRKRSRAMDIVPSLFSYAESIGSGGDPSPFALPQFDRADSDYSSLCLEFGELTSALDVDYLDAFQRLLRTPTVQIPQGGAIPEDLSTKITPIRLTRDPNNLSPDIYSGADGDGIFVGNPTRFDDLVHFWNLRASGFAVTFVPASTALRYSAYLRRRLARFGGSGQPDETICGWHLGAANDRPAEEELRPLVPEGAHLGYAHAGRLGELRKGFRVPMFRTRYLETLASTETSEAGRLQVSISLPERPLRSVCDRRGWSRDQVYVVSLDFDPGADGQTTLRLPRMRGLTARLGSAINLLANTVRAEAHSLGVIQPGRAEHLRVGAVQSDALLEAVFAVVGCTIRRSAARPMVDRVIQQCGGLEGCRVFKIGGVRAALFSPELARGARVGDLKRLIQENGQFDRHHGLYLEARKEPTLTDQAVIQYLVRVGVIRPGFLMTCPRCELDLWRFAEDVGLDLACERCGAAVHSATAVLGANEIRFRQGIPWQTGGAMDATWGGRRDSIQRRVRDALERGGQDKDTVAAEIINEFMEVTAETKRMDGAIPVILSLMSLRMGMGTGRPYIFVGPTSIQMGQEECESDLIVLTMKEDGRAEIVVGECKDRGTIREEGLRRLARVAGSLRSAGCKCYVLAAKLTENFEAAEIHAFNRMVKDWEEMILFTRRNLEGYRPYEGREARRLPHEHPSSLEDLFENSKREYLEGR